MDVAFDIGNTNTKLWTRENGEFSFHQIATGNWQELYKLLAGISIRRAILSTVREVPGHVISYVRAKCTESFVSLEDEKVQYPVDFSRYPEVGSDRKLLACAVAASPRCLVISCGTCITYNVVENKAFYGGAISPGLSLRGQAMSLFTGRLPFVQPDKASPDTSFPATGTEENMLSGIIIGACAEIQHFIRSWKREESDFVFLTGGDGELLEQYLAANCPVTFDATLPAKGLFSILDYQYDF